MVLLDAFKGAHAESATIESFTGTSPDDAALGIIFASDLKGALERESRVASASGKGQEIASGGVVAAWSYSTPEAAPAGPHITGRFFLGDEVVEIVLSTRAGTGGPLTTFGYSFPVPDKLRKAIKASLKARHLKTESGFSFPTCIRCPRAPYPLEAMNERIEGVVEIFVFVDASGTPKNPQVSRTLPAGLTQSALDTVRTWQLRPGTGPDGKSLDLVTPIQLSFQLIPTPAP